MSTARVVARWAAAGLATAVAACGSAAERASPPATSTSAAALPAVVAVLDKPFGSVPNTLRLLRLDGAELASTPLRDTDEAVTMAGRGALIIGAGSIRALDTAGRLRDVEAYPAASGSLVNGIIASPDGGRWLWTSVRQSPTGNVDSAVWLGSAGSVPRLLLERTAPGRALAALAWTRGGPVLSDEPVGIGGYILFRRGYGDTALVDLAHGALSPLSPSSCALSDLGSDGTIVCVTGGHEAPHGAAPVTLHVSRRGVDVLTLTFPAPTAQAGAALLSPDSTLVTVAWSPVTGNTPEVVSAEVVSLRDGGRRALPTGLRPLGWTSAGGIVATRDAGIGGGDPGTWLVHPDGAVSVVSPSPYALGVTG